MNRKPNYYNFWSKNGQKIQVRHIRPDDAPFLVNVFNHMTSESRYRRFHQNLDNVHPSRVWREAQNIAQADPEKNRGLLAFTECPLEGKVPVGAVRIVEISPEEAEVAISIRDDFQNLGIGTQLMRLMADEAEFLGYKVLVADIQNDNPAIWEVFSNLPYAVERTPKGSYSDIVVKLTASKE